VVGLVGELSTPKIPIEFAARQAIY